MSFGVTLCLIFSDTGNALALADDEERDEETARGLLTGLYTGCDSIPSAVYSPGELVHLLFSEGQDDNLYPGKTARYAALVACLSASVTSHPSTAYQPSIQP